MYSRGPGSYLQHSTHAVGDRADHISRVRLRTQSRPVLTDREPKRAVVPESGLNDWYLPTVTCSDCFDPRTRHVARTCPDLRQI